MNRKSKWNPMVTTWVHYLLLLKLCLVLPIYSSTASANGLVATFYEHENYGGTVISFPPGYYNTDILHGTTGNDEISSLRVPKGLKVTLFEDEHFRGSSITFYSDANTLSGWNDETSSILIEKLPDPEPFVTFYEHENYGGAAVQLVPGRYNTNILHMTTGNDEVSSFKVPAGLKVTLYDDENFQGNRNTWYKDANYLSGWNDEASSIVVEKTDYKGPFATLYENAGYGGYSQAFPLGRYNINELHSSVGHDEISSLKVPAGYRVVLYKDEDFKGSRSTFYKDTSTVVGFYGDDFQNEASSFVFEKVNDANAVISLAEYETDYGKSRLMETYAPKVWLARDSDGIDPYQPSSVEWAFQFMERYKHSDGNYWLRTKEKLSDPGDQSLAVFRGNIDNAPIYSFLVERANDTFDIIYYMYYPYNRGKKFLDTYFGNHVGDWEHITVRLIKTQNGMVPVQVYISAHDFGGEYDWSEVEKEGNHPVVYSAWGSHGVWKNAGTHIYNKIEVPVIGTTIYEFIDVSNKGLAWNTWYNMEQYYYNQARGLGHSSWPLWMNPDYSNPGVGNPSDPASGPIYRWGNTVQGEITITPDAKFARLENGPTGPPDKGVWKNIKK